MWCECRGAPGPALIPRWRCAGKPAELCEMFLSLWVRQCHSGCFRYWRESPRTGCYSEPARNRCWLQMSRLLCWETQQHWRTEKGWVNKPLMTILNMMNMHSSLGYQSNYWSTMACRFLIINRQVSLIWHLRNWVWDCLSIKWLNKVCVTDFIV